MRIIQPPTKSEIAMREKRRDAAARRQVRKAMPHLLRRKIVRVA